MNPATFLRVLGLNLECGLRGTLHSPDDGRYGQNPNRFQQHYQFQVILKPDPGNPQELYLQSLEALASTHASTTSASWRTTGKVRHWGVGLGWEVWLDGRKSRNSPIFSKPAD